MNIINSLNHSLNHSKIPPPPPNLNLRIWYKFVGNVNNSAPNYLSSNNGTVVIKSKGSQTQAIINPTLPNSNTTVQYMDTFVGGGNSFGSYSYINLGTISTLTLSQGFTISLWVYSTKTSSDIGDSFIIALNNLSGALSVGNYNNNISIMQAAGPSYNLYIFNGACSFTMSSNLWNYLCITLNSSNKINVYLNGTTILSNITNPYYPTSTSFINNSLGYYIPAGAHKSFAGKMADFRLYNSVLTEAQIGNIYAGYA